MPQNKMKKEFLVNSLVKMQYFAGLSLLISLWFRIDSFKLNYFETATLSLHYETTSANVVCVSVGLGYKSFFVIAPQVPLASDLLSSLQISTVARSWEDFPVISSKKFCYCIW